MFFATLISKNIQNWGITHSPRTRRDRFNKEHEDADPESNITDGEESFNQDHGEGNIRDYNIIDDGERVASAFRSASSVCSGIFNHG